MRDRNDLPPSDEPPRKERVLHARIPESLDEAIRAHAAGLGMSVSNLVRNVLANALDVASAAAGRPSRNGRRRTSHPDGPAALPPAGADAAVRPSVAATVLAWQDATLNLNAVCDRCNAVLTRGSRAAVAVTDLPTPHRPIRCLSCLEELAHDH